MQSDNARSNGATLSFSGGTLELSCPDSGVEWDLPDDLLFDERTQSYRAPAHRYAELVRTLHKRHPYTDLARNYEALEAGARALREPRPYQAEALQAWLDGQGQGVVVLPTGAGKSHLAVMAIDAKRRATLVVVPTLDLVRQWYDLLRVSFGGEIGVVGGGEHSVRALTVTTYDSAFIHMEHLGNRFGMIIFDECHHLPSESYALAARQALAPFRLGLTATPERADGKESLLEELIGPTLYRSDINELSGSYLAEYDVETVRVSLTAEERQEYDAQRAFYTGFLRQQGIRMGTPSGWGQFIIRSSVTEEGRRAMRAYRKQKELSVAAPAKLEVLAQLLVEHREDRMLIFTQDNATAYKISRRFLIPVITHQTKVTERSELLSALSEGRVNAIVTSKVLNEGVDVPTANVAVVLGGSGSVMEHVQRLGRILRRGENKRALLYEVISADTSEVGVSERRREHSAYQ